MKKKILILTADVGFGHRSAANAIAAALEEIYGERCQVVIANPLDDERTPAVLRDSQTDYDRMVRESPELYKFQYQVGDASISASLLERAFMVMLYRVMRDLLRQEEPDAVITTHAMFPAPLDAMESLGHYKGPFLTVITDLTNVHRLWLNPAADFCLLPTEDARNSAVKNGLPADRAVVTGIPVNPAVVNEHRPQEEIRAALGWRPEMKTVLVVGSKRVKNLEAVLDVLNHSALPVQWTIVCGGDDELFARLRQTRLHGVTHLYNFVDNLPEMMRAADCIITKAGGLITTEALACGLPLLLIDVTPGQEEGNASYVMQNGAAERAEDPVQALKILFHWLDNQGQLMAERAAASQALGRPRSAYQIAQLAWTAAENGPQPVSETRRRLMPRLREFLAQFGITEEPVS